MEEKSLRTFCPRLSESAKNKNLNNSQTTNGFDMIFGQKLGLIGGHIFQVWKFKNFFIFDYPNIFFMETYQADASIFGVE